MNLQQFDEAIAAQLPRVSHLQYDSHEICKHFAGEVRKQLEAQAAALCMCKDRPAVQCEELWGPKCDMGNNPKFVRVPPTPYAWPTLQDYERDVGFKVNEVFKMAWNLARTTVAKFRARL